MPYAKELNALCEGIECLVRRDLEREDAMPDDMRLNALCEGT